MSNLSRMAYYFAIQNLIFYSLQSALFMAMFDDDEDDERWLTKKERMINGSIDSVLRGSGVMGGVIATLKNMAIKWHEQRDKGWNKDESAVLMEMLNVSPPLGIKARKMVNAEKTLKYNKDVIKEMETFDIDNPQWSAYTNYIESTTNIPLNRLYNKTQNVRESLDNQHSALERALMFSGWSKWNIGLDDSEKIEEVKETIKKKKKIIAEEKAVIKKAEKIEEKKKEGEKKQAKEKKEGKEVTCLICKLPVVSGKKYCTVHEKKDQRKDGKKVQCKKIKKNKQRCGVMTGNKSGYCYYHD
jgi:glutamyl/glutaminyl-tRNA synthetase